MYKKETISAATQSCRPEKNRSSKPLFTGSTAITQTETQPETPLLKKEIEKKKHKYRPGRYEPANSFRSERSCYKIAGIYRHQPAAEKKNRPNQPGTKKKQHDPEKSPLFRRISKEQLVKESLHDQLLSYKNLYPVILYCTNGEITREAQKKSAQGVFLHLRQLFWEPSRYRASFSALPPDLTPCQTAAFPLRCFISQSNP